MKINFQKEYKIYSYNQGIKNRLRNSSACFEKYLFDNIDKYLDSAKGFFATDLTNTNIQGVILYTLKPWETKLLKKKVAKIDYVLFVPIDYDKKYYLALQLLFNILRLCKKEGIKMIFTRIKEQDVVLNNALEEAGFRVIETLLTFESLSLNKANNKTLTNFNIISYKSKYLQDVEKIAYESFRYSRLHADPLIPLEIAKKSRAEWVKNASYSNTTKIFLAQKKNDIIGFIMCHIAAKSDGHRTGIIDLIATHPNFTRQGVASILVNTAIKYYSSERCKVIVGTQAKNIPSVNLYIKLGFKLIDSEYTFVKHL